MLGELDEKQTISYCSEVENLDGKQTTQKQTNKQTNKQKKNKKQKIKKTPHNLISQSTSYLNSVRLVTSII